MVELFYKIDKNKVIFNGEGELIYYVPEKYFEIKAAEIIGELTRVMGMFMYAVFDKNGKRTVFKQFKCPSMIECKPSTITKEANYHLEGTKEPKAYRLMHFSKGDQLFCTSIPSEFSTLEKFVDLFKGGNLPETIPYDEVQNYILKNAELCNFDYKVSNQAIGIVISEIYRKEDDLSKPFRFSKTDDMLAYKALPVAKIPMYTSPFTAITSENADEAIAAAMTVAGDKDSPLEKIFMN